MSEFKKGSYVTPYSFYEYQNQLTNKQWTGGWVVNNGIKYYVTEQNEAQLPNSKGEERGSYQNPFSRKVYDEMYNKEFWMGGFIKDYDGEVRYYERHDGTETGSGCGCSGCGSDSGCGSGSGSGYIHLKAGRITDINAYVDDAYMEIEWGDGTFGGGNSLPPLSAKLVYWSGSEKKCNAIWVTPYHVLVSNIPETAFTLSFYIPEEYRY